MSVPSITDNAKFTGQSSGCQDVAGVSYCVSTSPGVATEVVNTDTENSQLISATSKTTAGSQSESALQLGWQVAYKGTTARVQSYFAPQWATADD